MLTRYINKVNGSKFFAMFGVANRARNHPTAILLKNEESAFF